jgi:DNA-binding response OmpR family regulator
MAEPSVLLVDDNPHILLAAARVLRKRGFVVHTSEGPFGVSAKVMEHRPDIIVLDAMMPALDGASLGKLLSTQSSTRAPKVIFFSALDEDQLRHIARSVPDASYVTKDEGIEALCEAIRARLGAEKKLL